MARTRDSRPTPAQEKVLRMLMHGDGKLYHGSSGHWHVGGHDEAFRLNNPVARATMLRMENLGWLVVVPQPGSEWTFQAPRRLTAAGRKALSRCPFAQSVREVTNSPQPQTQERP